MAIPCHSRGGREQFVGFQLLPGFFSSGTRQECQAQAAFVWSKQCPFTSAFKNPETKSVLQPNPTRCASLEGRQKNTPVPFTQCLILSAGDGDIPPGTDSRRVPCNRSGAARAALVTQSLPSIPCNSWKLHFSISLSPLSSDKISADLTEALTKQVQGKARSEEERLDSSSKG